MANYSNFGGIKIMPLEGGIYSFMIPRLKYVALGYLAVLLVELPRLRIEEESKFSVSLSIADRKSTV